MIQHEVLGVTSWLRLGNVAQRASRGGFSASSTQIPGLTMIEKLGIFQKVALEFLSSLTGGVVAVEGAAKSENLKSWKSELLGWT